MDEWVEVIGAYGRKYMSVKSALVDWLAGLDFQLTTGAYVSVGEAEAFNLGVNVRYGKNDSRVGTLRKVMR